MEPQEPQVQAPAFTPVEAEPATVAPTPVAPGPRTFVPVPASQQPPQSQQNQISDTSLLGSNPMDILKNLQISQRQ